jgi:hypothetical protein
MQRKQLKLGGMRQSSFIVRDESTKKDVSALECAPDFIRSHDAGMLVGGLANQATIDTLALVTTFV